MVKTHPQSIFGLVRSTFELTRRSAIQSFPFFVLGISGFIMVLLSDIWVESRPGNVAKQISFLKNHDISITVTVLLYTVFSFLTISLWVRLDRIAESKYISIVDSLKSGGQRFFPVAVTTLVIGGGLWLSEMIVEKGGVIGKGVGWALGFVVMVFGLTYVSAVILEGKGPCSGFRESMKLIRSNWCHVAGVFLYVLAIFSVLSALGLFIGVLILGSLSQFWGTLVLLLGIAYVTFLFLTVGASVSIVVYHDLRRRTESLEFRVYTEILNREVNEI